jgi:hypothetical protein
MWKTGRKSNLSERAVFFLEETERSVSMIYVKPGYFFIHVVFKFQFDNFPGEAVQMSGFCG